MLLLIVSSSNALIISKAVKEAVDNALMKHPDYSNNKLIKPNTQAEYRALIPDKHFFQTIELLLAYDNANLLNLISEYLFSDPNHEDADQNDAVLLSQIHTCLVRMHDSHNKKSGQ